ncbi:NAD(P)H-binding protein [Streptomyces sp. AC602_WCS936]|uniref:NAD(P)H-binding protein n=1 Tax=Streptomyces sp. AC602_WCS936 TaxID=2823685 RepID=UPI0027E405EF|nr:NAD(P)H-binding protein [Streptomyces sp. AC602_WCS936]
MVEYLQAQLGVEDADSHHGEAESRVALVEPDQCGGWPDTVHVVEGSITRPLECVRAFDGVEAVFLAGAHPSTVQDALTLARNAPARRVVLLSSHGPEHEEANPPETWFWLAIEKAVEHSGIAWTHIRPSAVMGAVVEGTYPATGSDWPDTIRADGVVREAFLDQGHYPFIHEQDLAAVVAAALISDDYTGTLVEAVGPPLSTRSRIQSIATALGRDIGMVDLAADESRAMWRRRGWPDGAIDAPPAAVRAGHHRPPTAHLPLHCSRSLTHDVAPNRKSQ